MDADKLKVNKHLHNYYLKDEKFIEEVQYKYILKYLNNILKLMLLPICLVPQIISTEVERICNLGKNILIHCYISKCDYTFLFLLHYNVRYHSIH